ncbi:MAG: tetratricopeptide repeat protein [Acidobacteriaceae bacterium]|nr:tetratricopeptide repeat protein [Acidobacteriaceae bacterium]
MVQIDPAAGYLALVEIATDRHKPQSQIEDLYWKAVKARPESYDARVRLAQYLRSDTLRKYAEAENQCREALRIDPNRIQAYVILAGALAAEGKWADVESALASASEAIPDNATPYFAVAALCLARSVELERSERYFRRYLAQRPEYKMPSLAAAHWRLGQVLEKEGRKTEALAEFQLAAKLDPTSPARNDLKRLGSSASVRFMLPLGARWSRA